MPNFFMDVCYAVVECTGKVSTDLLNDLSITYSIRKYIRRLTLNLS